MKTASALRESMWGMMSELHLNAPGVDYVAYAAEYRDRFERMYAEHSRQDRKIMTAIPDHAEIVVIGGGIIGCSTQPRPSA